MLVPPFAKHGTVVKQEIYRKVPAKKWRINLEQKSVMNNSRFKTRPHFLQELLNHLERLPPFEE